MNKSEIIKLIAILSINYKNFPEAGKEEMLINLWHNMLDDIDFEIGEIVIKKHMSESVFAPTIADIRQKISEIMKGNMKTSIEAWGDVTKIIRKYGSYRESEALNELDSLTRKVVESLGYRNLCISENVMADRAHFLKTYDTLAERTNKENLLNPAIANKLNLQLENGFKKIGGI